MRALPSYWRGTIFRSRTEARWAVFFDAIRLRWDYEPEGFILSDGTWYLPDFWLPEMQTWVEVKPRDMVSDEERHRIELLVQGSGHDCLLLDGSPHPTVFRMCVPLGEDVAWEEVSFNDKHTAERHDGAPRMYYGPADYEPTEEELVAAAMQLARSRELREPGEADVLPTGWNGIPFAQPDAELTERDRADLVEELWTRDAHGAA